MPFPLVKADIDPVMGPSGKPGGFFRGRTPTTVRGWVVFCHRAKASTIPADRQNRYNFPVRLSNYTSLFHDAGFAVDSTEAQDWILTLGGGPGGGRRRGIENMADVPGNPSADASAREWTEKIIGTGVYHSRIYPSIRRIR